MIRRILSLLTVLAIVAPARAAVDLGIVHGDGGQSGAFLDQTASARTIGMGQAFTGVADDAAALHANVAGLVQLKRPDVVSMYSSLYEDTTYGSAMYAAPLRNGGAFGAGLIDLRSAGFKKTNANRERIGTYDNSQTALYAGYARMWGRYGVGAAVKMVQQKVDVYSGTGYGLDLGGFLPVNKKLNLGLNLQNLIAPSLQLKSETETYARSVKFGARYKMGPRWSLSGDLQQTQGRSIKPLLGSEVAVAEVVVLRAGLNERELNAGIGFKIGQWSLDYALGFQGGLVGDSELGTSHRFGLHFVFAGKEQDQVRNDSPVTRPDVKSVLALMEDEMVALRVSTPAASHVMALEALVNETIGKNRMTMPLEIVQTDAQMRLIKGDAPAALPGLVLAARLQPYDENNRNNLQLALSRIPAETQAQMASQLMSEAQAAFQAGNYTEAASKTLVVLTLQPGDAADTLNKRARLALLSSMDLRQAQITDALLRDKVNDAYDRAAAAFNLDPLNDRTQRQIQQIALKIENKKLQPGYIGPSVDLYRIGQRQKAEGKWNEARDSWRKAIQIYRNNALAKEALISANAQSKND